MKLLQTEQQGQLPDSSPAPAPSQHNLIELSTVTSSYTSLKLCRLS